MVGGCGVSLSVTLNWILNHMESSLWVPVGACLLLRLSLGAPDRKHLSRREAPLTSYEGKLTKDLKARNGQACKNRTETGQAVSRCNPHHVLCFNPLFPSLPGSILRSSKLMCRIGCNVDCAFSQRLSIPTTPPALLHHLVYAPPL